MRSFAADLYFMKMEMLLRNRRWLCGVQAFVLIRTNVKGSLSNWNQAERDFGIGLAGF